MRRAVCVSSSSSARRASAPAAWPSTRALSFAPAATPRRSSSSRSACPGAAQGSPTCDQLKKGEGGSRAAHGFNARVSETLRGHGRNRVCVACALRVRCVCACCVCVCVCAHHTCMSRSARRRSFSRPHSSSRPMIIIVCVDCRARLATSDSYLLGRACAQTHTHARTHAHTHTQAHTHTHRHTQRENTQRTHTHTPQRENTCEEGGCVHRQREPSHRYLG